MHIRPLLVTAALAATATASLAQRTPAVRAEPGRLQVIQVTGGAPDTTRVGAARPRFRRVTPLEIREIPEFSAQTPSRSFTLAPMRLVEPGRARLEFTAANVFPDDGDGYARLWGAERLSSYVSLYLTVAAGRTYVLEFIAHPFEQGPWKVFTISTPTGFHDVSLSWDNPRAIIGYTATSAGTYRFLLQLDTMDFWYFQGVTVTLLE